jgi:hypothetical protein
MKKIRFYFFVMSLSLSLAGSVAYAGENNAPPEKFSASFLESSVSMATCFAVRSAIGASFGVTSQIRSIIALTSWKNIHGDPCYGDISVTPAGRAFAQGQLALVAAWVGGGLGAMSCLVY